MMLMAAVQVQVQRPQKAAPAVRGGLPPRDGEAEVDARGQRGFWDEVRGRQGTVPKQQRTRRGRIGGSGTSRGGGGCCDGEGGKCGQSPA